MRSFLCIIALIGLVAFTGCNSANKTSRDTVTVAGGRADAVLTSPVPKTTSTARRVAVDLKLTIVQYTSDDKEGRIVAYTETTQRIDISVRPDPQGSYVIVQTEGRGGEIASNEIITRIRKAL